jgi:hypothetical protein
MIRRLITLLLVFAALYGGYLLFTEVLGPMIEGKQAMGTNADGEEAEEESDTYENELPE